MADQGVGVRGGTREGALRSSCDAQHAPPTCPPRRIAAQNARLDAVAALMAAGSSVDAANKDNVTPLSVAVQLGHTEIAAALLKGKADPKRAPISKPAERSPLDLMMLSVANNTCLRCKEANARYKCRRCGMARYCRGEVGQGARTAAKFHGPRAPFLHWQLPPAFLTYYRPPPPSLPVPKVRPPHPQVRVQARCEGHRGGGEVLREGRARGELRAKERRGPSRKEAVLAGAGYASERLARGERRKQRRCPAATGKTVRVAALAQPRHLAPPPD